MSELGFGGRWDELSPEQRVLLARRLSAGQNLAEVSPITRRPDVAVAPVSFAQQRIWFLDQLVQGSSFYVESSALRLQSDIAVDVLERSINEIVRRHEILRTTFHEVDGQPVQVVAASMHVPLTFRDLRHLEEAERQGLVTSVAMQTARQPFDLAQGPLIRTSMLRVGATDWVFLLSVHHIIWDGWSTEVFTRELTTLYQAFSLGQPSPLPELTVQYADFAAWQRDSLAGEQLDSELEYWRTQLADLPVLDLPTDRPRPGVFRYEGDHYDFELPRTLSAALKRLARHERTTLFIVLLAGFVALLHRYSGQDDIVVGAPIANRNRRQLEDLIGFFVNTLVLRTDLHGDRTFRQLLDRVRHVAVAAYAHQDVPFEKVVEELHPERDLSRNPLFQVIVQLHNAARGGGTPEGSISLLDVQKSTVKFDLRLDFFEGLDGLQASVEYSTELFERPRIERLADNLQTMLTAMVSDPDGAVGDVDLLKEQERQQLATWGRIGPGLAVELTVPDVFDAQVRRSPDAVAVIMGDRSLTYRQLDDLSTLVAYRLQTSGLSAESSVGLATTRAPETVAAILGILKAGCFYVPLDPGYPDDRLRFMLADADVRTVLAAAGDVDRFRSLGVSVSDLEAMLEAKVGGIHARRSGRPALPDSLAYVMYTSGSTGEPKGVAVTHRAIVRLVIDADYAQLNPDEVFVLLAPLTFDATTLELWGPLLNGGRLVIAPTGEVGPDELADLIATYGVTTLWLTAGLFHQIVATHVHALAGVRQLLAGGDVLQPAAVRKVLDDVPGCRVINGYGPTENTTFSSCYLVPSGHAATTRVPIGTPIHGTHAVVVDASLRLTPLGVAGELCLGGDGVARGYVNDPRLTAEKFVPDPFSSTPGGRMYRTGDQVRYSATGELEFRGRMDRQVKVRGFRVEPGEIESALIEHPWIQAAAVIARDDERGGRRLTAYVVPTESDDAVQQKVSETTNTLVSNWKAVYQDLYAEPAAVPADGEDYIGWRSSITALDIPAEEMREWRDATVARIAALRSRRILEIGVGTGLLLCRLAPHAERYLATDFSPAAFHRLRSAMRISGVDQSNVELSVRGADDFGGIEPGSFDLVILNSVVQYFPSVAFLQHVIDRAIDTLAPGGAVFVGDVRSLPLLEAFHGYVAMAGADDNSLASDVLDRIHRGRDLEQELVLDPRFFESLPECNQRVAEVDVQVKRGRASNELTKFRYDVTIHTSPGSHRPLAQTIEWQSSGDDLSRFGRRLADPALQMLTVTGVPNARVATDVRTVELLTDPRSPATVAAVRRILAEERVEGVDPDALSHLGDRAGFEVRVRPVPDGSGAYVDVAFLRRRQQPGESPERVAVAWPEVVPSRSRELRSYATNPFKGLLARELVPQLRGFLGRRLPEFMMPSSFVIVDNIPLTRNGKPDRAALPDPGSERPAVGATYTSPTNMIEARLAEIWASVIGVDRVGIHDNFFELGGDSILCIQIISRARAVGVNFTARQVFQNQTIAELAAVATAGGPTGAEQGTLIGPCSLTPIQHWFFEQQLENLNHFNQAIMLEIPYQIDARMVAASLNAVVLHHDALRLRFARDENRIWQAKYVAPNEATAFSEHDLSAVPEAQLGKAIESTAGRIQASLDVTQGPVLRAALLRLGGRRRCRLLLAVHHLVVDAVSWRVLLEDFWTAYSQLGGTGVATFAAKTTSYRHWAGRLKEYAYSPAAEAELEHWLAVVEGGSVEIPVDFDHGPNTNASTEVCTLSLGADETSALLVEAPRAYRAQVNDVLVTALGQALTSWCGTETICIDIEGHGREDIFEGIDLTRTIGWFTAIAPIRLAAAQPGNLSRALGLVSEQLRGGVSRGLGFGVLSYLSSNPEVVSALAALPKRRVVFNYFGRFTGASGEGRFPIRPASESCGAMRDPASLRQHAIEINGSVAAGMLTVEWSFSRNLHRRSTIEGVAARFVDSLRSFLTDSAMAQAHSLTPADFPAARLDQSDVDIMIAKLQSSER